MSFQINLKPQRRAATDFIGVLRRKLKTAIAETQAEAQEAESFNQSGIANRLGIHRSVISRELNGSSDITAGRIAEIAWAIGRNVEIDFPKRKDTTGANFHSEPFKTTTETYSFPAGNEGEVSSSAAKMEHVND